MTSTDQFCGLLNDSEPVVEDSWQPARPAGSRGPRLPPKHGGDTVSLNVHNRPSFPSFQEQRHMQDEQGDMEEHPSTLLHTLAFAAEQTMKQESESDLLADAQQLAADTLQSLAPDASHCIAMQKAGEDRDAADNVPADLESKQPAVDNPEFHDLPTPQSKAINVKAEPATDSVGGEKGTEDTTDAPTMQQQSSAENKTKITFQEDEAVAPRPHAPSRKRSRRQPSGSDDGADGAAKHIKLGKHMQAISQETMQASHSKPQVVHWRRTGKSLQVIFVYQGQVFSGYLSDKQHQELLPLGGDDSGSGQHANCEVAGSGNLNALFDRAGPAEGAPAVTQAPSASGGDGPRSRRSRAQRDYFKLAEGVGMMEPAVEVADSNWAATSKEEPDALDQRAMERRAQYERDYYRMEREGPQPGATCALCKGLEDQPRRGGVSLGKFLVVRAKNNRPPVWVHEQCGLFAAEVNAPEQDDATRAMSLENKVGAAVRRGYLTRCSACSRSGGVCGCIVAGCNNTYHLPCAIELGCFYAVPPHDHRPCRAIDGIRSDRYFFGCPIHYKYVEEQYREWKRMQLLHELQQHGMPPSNGPNPQSLAAQQLLATVAASGASDVLAARTGLDQNQVLGLIQALANSGGVASSNGGGLANLLNNSLHAGHGGMQHSSTRRGNRGMDPMLSTPARSSRVRQRLHRESDGEDDDVDIGEAQPPHAMAQHAAMLDNDYGASPSLHRHTLCSPPSSIANADLRTAASLLLHAGGQAGHSSARSNHSSRGRPKWN